MHTRTLSCRRYAIEAVRSSDDKSVTPNLLLLPLLVEACVDAALGSSGSAACWAMESLAHQLNRQGDDQ